VGFGFRRKKYKQYIIMVFTITNTIGKYAKNKVGGGGTWYYYGSGSQYFAKSNDGFLWTSTGNGTGLTDGNRAMVYANNTFIAAGSMYNSPNYTISTSTNSGVSWSLKLLPISPQIGRGVAYGNGTWVSTNGSYQAYLSYSTNNGTGWNQCSSYGGLTTAVGIAYGKDALGAGLWVATGQGGNNIAYSTTGISFTANPEPVSIAGNCVAYGKDGSGAGLWVCGGPNIVYSSNGNSSWTAVLTGSKGGLTQVNGVAYGVDGSGAGLWVAVGSGGNKIAYSSNGSSWTQSVLLNGIFTTGYGVACGTDNTGKTLWIAVGADGNKIATSLNGTSWTGQSATTTNIGIIFGVLFKPP
jgi:hypothetical protein